ncbi:MAG: tRNA (N6-isopentenyl adenosine(37)-C2)-methylthiotransferase MiaB [Hydrogenoanaerobacterium sp.]
MTASPYAELTETGLSCQFAYIENIKKLLQAHYNRAPRAFTHSYGCQANSNDGEKINGMLSRMGYIFTDDITDADFVLYNTCAIRKGAEDKIFGKVGELQHQKRLRPNMIIALCGCMMQQKQISEKIKKSYPFVDLIFGTHAMHKFPELIYSALTTKERVFFVDESDDIIAENMPILRDGKIKASLQIMYGCDNFCTYCIVPYVRGREHSRRPQSIIDEIKGLVADGYKEINLLGQNVNSYGKGLDEAVNFPSLLRRICAIEGDFIVRFMTSHPKDCTHELIDTIAECDKLCKHIHLPVQSGSNRILKLMNRHYTREEYLNLVQYAKNKVQGISFTSDIIIGFPGETHDDILETISLIKEVEYDTLFTFIYSKREGTKAALMSDTAKEKEKSLWFSEVQAAQNKISRKHNAALVGQSFRVLAQGEGRTGEGYLTGRTSTNAIVDFKAPKELLGTFVNVKITEALSWAVIGEVI